MAAGAGGRPRGGGVPDSLLVGGLATMLGITVLVWSATGVAGWVAHGQWPDGVRFTRTATAIRSLLTGPGDVADAWPAAAPDTLPGAGLLWLIFFAQVLVLFSSVLWAAVRVARWRARDRPPGIGTDGSPAEDLSAAVESTAPAPADQPASVRPPSSSGSPRGAGPSVTEVLAAPPGTVVVDPAGALWQQTARTRRSTGPVHVYDPGHATDAPVRLRWAPERGCADMRVARARAAALLAPSRPREAVFQLDVETSETLLRCFLHAAALTGQPLQHVRSWLNGKSTGEPAKILRTHTKAAGGASMELNSSLTSHPERREAGLALARDALAGLDQPHIRQACTAGKVDALAVDRISEEGGTLYVVGSGQETAALRHALMAAVSEHLHVVGSVGHARPH